MRGRALSAGLVALVLLSKTLVLSTGVHAASTVPLATRQTLFVIPFKVQPTRESSREPVEIQLYVSADRGETWELTECVEPSRGHFLFRAGGDGEYWFLIRTLDRSGRLRPREVAGTGLRVIVDTTPPSLRIEAERGQAGEVLLRWNVTETHPGPEPLAVQYRAGHEAPWSAVAIPRRSPSDFDPEQVGQVAWWPPRDAQRLEIRAEVRDRAGNSAVSHAQIGLREEVSLSEDVQAASFPPRTNETAFSESRNPWSRVEPIAESRVTVHSRHFALNYAFPEKQLPACVEIWLTPDHGRTWHLYGLDDDRRSPAAISVERPGDYGFRIIARDHQGHGGARPQIGDPPDISVCVVPDQPPARMTSIQAIPDFGPTTAIR